MWLLQIVNQETINTSFELFEKLNLKFWTRISIDLVSVFILIRFIYYPIYWFCVIDANSFHNIIHQSSVTNSDIEIFIC